MPDPCHSSPHDRPSVVRGSFVDPNAVHVEMRPRPAAWTGWIPDCVRLEVARIAQVLLHHRLVQFYAQAGRVRDGDVAILDERLRDARDEFLPPRNNIANGRRGARFSEGPRARRVGGARMRPPPASGQGAESARGPSKKQGPYLIAGEGGLR